MSPGRRKVKTHTSRGTLAFRTELPEKRTGRAIQTLAVHPQGWRRCLFVLRVTVQSLAEPVADAGRELAEGPALSRQHLDVVLGY